MLLSCGRAESGWGRLAEHWGWRQDEARALIAADDWGGLAALTADVWPDVSFGYAQFVVAWHYVGDGSASVNNCLAVREYVRAHPDEDIAQMAAKLAYCLEAADREDLSPVGGDRELMALVAYNAGHVPWPGASYWTKFVENVDNYRAALTWARGIA